MLERKNDFSWWWRENKVMVSEGNWKREGGKDCGKEETLREEGSSVKGRKIIRKGT